METAIFYHLMIGSLLTFAFLFEIARGKVPLKDLKERWFTQGGALFWCVVLLTIGWPFIAVIAISDMWRDRA